MEFIACKSCGKDMPKLRLEKFGYKVCVNCSTEKPKVARNMTYGTGDHTYNEIQILSSEDAERIRRQEELEQKNSYGKNRTSS